MPKKYGRWFVKFREDHLTMLSRVRSNSVFFSMQEEKYDFRVPIYSFRGNLLDFASCVCCVRVTHEHSTGQGQVRSNSCTWICEQKHALASMRVSTCGPSFFLRANIFRYFMPVRARVPRTFVIYRVCKNVCVCSVCWYIQCMYACMYVSVYICMYIYRHTHARAHT